MFLAIGYSSSATGGPVGELMGREGVGWATVRGGSSAMRVVWSNSGGSTVGDVFNLKEPFFTP